MRLASKRTAALAVAVSAGAAAMPIADASAVGVVTREAEAIAPVTRMAVRAHHRKVRVHERAVRRNVRLARTNARLKGKHSHRTPNDVRDWTTDHLIDTNVGLRRSNRKLRRLAARAEAQAAAQARTTAAATSSTSTTATTPAAPPAPVASSTAPPHLESIAACESGGNPSAVDPTGTYRGKYQFDMQTWASVGGSGDPAAASEAEQDQRASALYSRSGANPWPVCGR